MSHTENQKKIRTKKEILANLDKISERKSFNFELKGLTRTTRDLLSDLIDKILAHNNIDNPEAGFHIFSSMMEILLNALKGNIRFVIYKDELLKKLDGGKPGDKEAEQLVKTILTTASLRDAMDRYVIPEKLKTSVQTILRLEEKIRVKKLQLDDDEAELLNSIRDLLDKGDYRICMKIVVTKSDIYIRIHNNVPIMLDDQDRIMSSRRVHHRLFLEGRSGDFFRPEYLDEKESAGLGIAMVDEGYYNLGLNPIDLFSVTTSSKSTTIYMKYPVKALQEAKPL